MHHLLLPLRVPAECDLAAQLRSARQQQRRTTTTATLSEDRGDTSPAAAAADDDSGDDHPPRDAAEEPRPRAAAGDCDYGECDWEYVAELRQTVTQLLESGEMDAVSDHLDALQEYGAALQQLCERDGDRHSNHPVQLQLQLPWKSGFAGQTETGSGWAWERGNVLYNVVCVHVHRACRERRSAAASSANNNNGNGNNRQAWTAAGQHLQHAAALLRHLRCSVLLPPPAQQQPAAELQVPFLQLWETHCLAEAQYCVYCTFRGQPRPKHFLLAKLAAAANALFAQAEEQLVQLQQQPRAPRDDFDGASPESPLPLDLPCLGDWDDSVRAWGIWMTAAAEYHQSLVHRAQQEWGPELARLEAGLQFARLCREFCDPSSDHLLDGLAATAQPVHEEMDERYRAAQRDNAARHRAAVPDYDELAEIAPQQIVRADPDAVPKLLPAALSRPLFREAAAAAADHPGAIGRYVATFRSDLQNLLTGAEQLADETTENARGQLASVHLPHALTVYKQEQQSNNNNGAGGGGAMGGGGGSAPASSGGGGIPDALWQRVQDAQRERRSVEHLKQDLWQLQDMAETARTTFRRIGEVLEEDLELDSLFRRQNPMFEGHDVPDIQKSFRQALQNYHRLMVSANESDTLLVRRGEGLESDSKFRLLNLPRSQLDRLVATATRAQTEIDVSHLSALLVQLSKLFTARDQLVHRLRERFQNTCGGIAQELGTCPSEAEYPQVLQDATASFQQIVDELDANIEQQGKILYHIMQENDQFLQLRDRASREAASDNALVKLEDALEELELFSKHVREGRTFYDVVIPKLEKLQHQVQDVSNRLAQERQDHEDYNATRSRSQIGSGSSRYPGGGGGASSGIVGGGGGGGGGGYDSRSGGGSGGGDGPLGRYENVCPSPRGTVPSAAAAAAAPQSSYGNGHDTAEVLVDDEKVANLVAMDFDPEKVVAALKRNDNNLEQALNDLLSC